MNHYARIREQRMKTCPYCGARLTLRGNMLYCFSCDYKKEVKEKK